VVRKSFYCEILLALFAVSIQDTATFATCP